MSIFSETSVAESTIDRISEIQTVEELKELCNHPPSQIHCKRCVAWSRGKGSHYSGIMIPKGLKRYDDLPDDYEIEKDTVEYRCSSNLHEHHFTAEWDPKDRKYAWQISERFLKLFEQAYGEAYLRALEIPMSYNGHTVKDTIRIYMDDNSEPDYSKMKDRLEPLEYLFGNTDFTDVRRILAFSLMNDQLIGDWFVPKKINVKGITKIEAVVNNQMLDIQIHYDSVIRRTSTPLSRIVQIVSDPDP